MNETEDIKIHYFAPVADALISVFVYFLFIHQGQLKRILFLIDPNFSMEISTTSLCFKYLGSFIDIATPAGVPVDIISPGSIVIKLLNEDIIFRIGITILLLEEFCLIS